MKKAGSALLIVVLVSGVLTILAGRYFWIEALSSRACLAYKEEQRMQILLDGMVEYAVAYYATGMHENKNFFDCSVPSFPFCDGLDGFHATCSYQVVQDQIKVCVNLFCYQEVRKKIHFFIEKRVDGIFITSLERL